MKNRRFPLSRRALLRGTGAALALPWLEAMMPARAKAARAVARPPVRMAVLYMPNGVHPGKWTPEGEGRDFKLSPTLEPLHDLKDIIIVPTNLWNQASRGGDGHYVKVSGFLTSTTITKTQGADLNCNGISMDQLAAQKAGRATPLPSLELGITPVSTGVDTNVGYTRVYGAHVSWAGPTQPLARETNPRLVFERCSGRTIRSRNPASGISSCSTACSTTPASCAGKWAWPIDIASTNTCQSCALSKIASSGRPVWSAATGFPEPRSMQPPSRSEFPRSSPSMSA